MIEKLKMTKGKKVGKLSLDVVNKARQSFSWSRKCRTKNDLVGLACQGRRDVMMASRDGQESWSCSIVPKYSGLVYIFWCRVRFRMMKFCPEPNLSQLKVE